MASPDASSAIVDAFTDSAINDAETLTPRGQLEEIETSSETRIPDLTSTVFVVRTEANIPHIYAENRLDLMRVYGYMVATDRFWMMDLARRLGSGRLSALFGSTVLSTNITDPKA